LLFPLPGVIQKPTAKTKKPQAFAARGFCLKINFSAKQAGPYKNNTKNKICLLCKISYASPFESQVNHIFIFKSRGFRIIWQYS
jgi:hypothetical protein